MRSDWHRRAIILLWICLFLIYSSCGGVKKEQRQTQINKATRQAQQDVETEDFQRAIDAYEKIIQKYPNDLTLQSGYIKILESINKRADRTLEKGDFPQAGRAYSILLRDFPSSKQLSQALTYNKTILMEKIGTCRMILFEKALHEYRSGDLNQAIFIWKTILTFDPENQEIKKMLDIATAQSENLEKVK